MTLEDKELLLKDLCARLPYGVKLHIPSFSDTPQLLQQISDYETVEINDYTSPVGVGEVKPYLRPMSSMTDAEKKELEDICTMYNGDPSSSYEYFGIEIFNISRYGTNFESDYTAIDWLNSHHFDYRGLIEKGLALESPEGMYN